MNTKIFLPFALFLLAACRPNDTAPAAASESAPAASAASAAPASAAKNTIQTLNSTDGKIRILIENGRFHDVIQDRSLHPKDISDSGLILLQQDTDKNITLYAADLGEAKTDAKTYFGNLKAMLQSAGNTESLRIGIATANRMNYRFAQNNGEGGRFSENCVAIHETNIYTVCAGSTAASVEELDFVLKDINLVK